MGSWVEIVSGNPERLEAYTQRMRMTHGPLRGEIEDLAQAIRTFNGLPNELGFTLKDGTALCCAVVDDFEELDRKPEAFAWALRQADRSGNDVLSTTLTSGMFDALVQARLDHPYAPDEDIYKEALDAYTGTPEQLAAELRRLIEATNGLSEKDISALQGVLADAANDIEYPPLIGGPWGRARHDHDFPTLDPGLIASLESAVAKLDARADDAQYLTELYEALGPQATAKLPTAISKLAWSEAYRSGGDIGFNGKGMIDTVSSTLATASHHLDDQWRADLFAAGVRTEQRRRGFLKLDEYDVSVVDDAFPLLFSREQLSTEFACDAGQLGIDIVKGDVWVERGLGSPFYEGFDQLNTHWAERGAMLISAASRTPEAANTLLQNPENAKAVTSDKFGWREATLAPDQETPWDIVGVPAGDLVTAATVTYAGTDHDAARQAAVEVIKGAIAEGPGSASEALAPAYGDMALTYLGDFADNALYKSPPAFRNGAIKIGMYEAAQFTALAMGDEGSRAKVFNLREIMGMQIAIDGIEEDIRTGGDSGWETRLGHLNAIVLVSAMGERYESAAQLDAANKEYNGNVDLSQDLVLSFVKIPPGVDVLTDEMLKQLKDDHVYRDTNNVEAARNEVTEDVYEGIDFEQRVVAMSHLAAALRAESPTIGQQRVIDHAKEHLGADVVEALRNHESVDIDPYGLGDFAGSFSSVESTPVDADYTQVSRDRNNAMPADEQGLWPEE